MTEFIDELVETLHNRSSEEMALFLRSSYWGWGSCQQRERLEAVSSLCAESFPGDLLEIGCRRGETTVVLAQVAQAAGRRIIAVDPWQVGRQNCDDDSEFQDFLRNTAKPGNVIDIVRLPSQDPEAIRYMKERQLAFAFVDGWHTYEGCMSDILAVAHCPVIAVDDTLWNPYVMTAFFEAGEKLKRKKIQHPLCREAYLL